MKNKDIHTHKFSGLRLILLLGLSLAANLSILFSQSEEDSIAEKPTARIGLVYTQVNKDGRLVVTVKTKVDRSFENVPGVKVDFYQTEIAAENLLGKAITNNKGQADFPLPDSLQKDQEILHTYVAAIEGNAQFEDVAEEIIVKKAVLQMTLEEEDSTYWVKVFVGSPDESGEIVPAPDVECKGVVKRLHGNLPVAEEFDVTDEDGMMSVEFPRDIPGDKEGNLTIIAMVEEHEEFGTLETIEVKAWGVPLVISQQTFRELWSDRANAPYSLMILTNVILLGVWGTIAYIVARLFKVFKIGKTSISASK